jgi:hypothetical protein
MRKLMIGALLLQGCLLLAAAGAARAEDKPPEAFVYSTYYVCDVTQQERSDQIFKDVDQQFYDAAVADGSITAYGLYAHNTGGRWRRAMFAVAPSIQALLDSQKKIGDQADAKNKKLEDEYGKICNTHDDYIWRRVAGNAGTTAPGNAVFSTYYVCDSREDQADAIVTQVYAPAYDKLVADGKLKTWGWMEHVVGGEYRRLATMTATDVKSLLEVRASIVESQDNALGDAFTNVCSSHTDYIWEVKASGNR